MAINFNQNSVFNLKPISNDSVRGEVNGLLINGEEVIYAFQTVRDQLVFTNKRIIAIDVQGLTGKRKSFSNNGLTGNKKFILQRLKKKPKMEGFQIRHCSALIKTETYLLEQ